MQFITRSEVEFSRRWSWLLSPPPLHHVISVVRGRRCQVCSGSAAAAAGQVRECGPCRPCCRPAAVRRAGRLSNLARRQAPYLLPACVRLDVNTRRRRPRALFGAIITYKPNICVCGRAARKLQRPRESFELSTRPSQSVACVLRQCFMAAVQRKSSANYGRRLLPTIDKISWILHRTSLIRLTRNAEHAISCLRSVVAKP